MGIKYFVLKMKTYAATIAALFAASAGQWYEQERDAVFTFEMDQMCATANYQMNADGKLDAQYGAMIPMNFYQYGYSPKGEMDCSAGYNCQITMGEDREDKEPITWGVLGTDNENWHVAYYCGTLMGMQMSWLAIYGKQLEISEEHLAAAKDAIQAKLPGYIMGWPMTKKSVQGDFFGGSCQYDWDW